MGASIPIPFALGEQIWYCGSGARVVVEVCPECVGTLRVTLTLGNGESYTLACACCARGVEPPSGTIARTVYEYVPTEFTPRRVEVRGNEYIYSQSEPDATCYQTANANDLFTEEQDCAEACVVKNAAQAAHVTALGITHLQSKRHELAWSVHYWRGMVAKLRTDLTRAEERLGICRQKERD